MGWVVKAAQAWCLGRFTPGKGTHYPLCRRLGGPQGQSGRVRKISPLTVFFLRSEFRQCFFCLDCLAFSLLCFTVQHTTQTSMLLAGFEPAIPATDRPQTLALDRSVTGIGPTGIRSPDRPARNESLYRLHHRG